MLIGRVVMMMTVIMMTIRMVVAMIWRMATMNRRVVTDLVEATQRVRHCDQIMHEPSSR